MNEKDMQERFLGDVKDHRCVVLREDGPDRHIRCRKPGTISYGFDIITWPGHLCISGDCGTYVFQRIYDMFEFFKCSSTKRYPINSGYWAEKVLAQDKIGEIVRFSEEKFNKAVLSDFQEFAKHGRHNPEQIREIWRDIREDILNPENEHTAYERVYSYQKHGFSFQDFFDHILMEYTFSYLWCLYAIVWTIREYEKLATDALREMNRC